MLGVFVVGFPGYFVFDHIWPSFYYSPVPTGKNAWLLGQGLFILIYFCGAIMAFNSERHALNAISASCGWLKRRIKMSKIWVGLFTALLLTACNQPAQQNQLQSQASGEFSL